MNASLADGQEPDGWGRDRLALQHLLLRLKPVNRALRAAAGSRADENARLVRAGANANSLTERHVEQLFGALDRFIEGDPQLGACFELTAQEAGLEDRMRRSASDAGFELPLDALVHALNLSRFELHVVLICAAAHLHPAYARVFAYVHDDMHRLAPSLQLLMSLDASGLHEQVCRRNALEPHGKLCRVRLLRIVSESENPLLREFSLDPAAFQALMQPGADWAARFFDADDVSGEALPLGLFPDAAMLGRVVKLLEAGRPVVGLWGPRHFGGRDIAKSLASAMQKPLRKLPGTPEDEAGVRRALHTAGALGAVVWLDTDELPGEWRRTRNAEEGFGTVLASAPSPVVLTGTVPWHPVSLLARRDPIDVQLTSPGPGHRAALWQSIVKGVDVDACRVLSERFQMSAGDIGIAAKVARLDSKLRTNGVACPMEQALPRACRTVALRGSTEFAKIIVPRRRPEDLVLPADLHARVLEVGAFYRSWSRVDETWGFGRMLSGGGIKVLMTGDSGTGKTAAAEVIAGQIGAEQTLLKVHLASVVSKWVGETEKNLDAVFQHAEDSHSVLFFDEADALFGKRGEVERGSDRYSNLEVGFLLQRLEDFAGLAILASNHKDQIDEAFMRRFQVVLHFPRPGPAERRRIWELALPPQAPLASDIDIDLLQQLDLTGAGIVGAARTAALLAANEPGAAITMSHLIRAVTRQFQQEARLLPAAQLGRYSSLAEAGP